MPATAFFITAQGLFMYLHEHEVYTVLHRCADNFPGGALMLIAMARLFTVSFGGNTVLNTLFMRGNGMATGGTNFLRCPGIRPSRRRASG